MLATFICNINVNKIRLNFYLKNCLNINENLGDQYICQSKNMMRLLELLLK